MCGFDKEKLSTAGKSLSVSVSEFLCFHEALDVLNTLHVMLGLNVILIPCT